MKTTRIFDWFTQAKGRSIPVSGTIIKEKVIKIGKTLGIEEFTVSNSWPFLYETWLLDWSVVKVMTLSLYCIVSELERQAARDFCDDRLNDIFSLGECGLFYYALPSITLFFKNINCKGGKTGKERLTVTLYVSETGEKVLPLVIGKYK